MSHVYTTPLPDEARAAILKEVCDYAESLGLAWHTRPEVAGIIIKLNYDPPYWARRTTGDVQLYITYDGTVSRSSYGILTVEHPKSTLRFLEDVVRNHADQLAETLE